MSESECIETEHGLSFTVDAKGLSIGQNDQRIALTPRDTWDLLELLNRHRGELFQMLHPESMSTEQEVRAFARHYVSTSYDVEQFSIESCMRISEPGEDDDPDEWEVLVSWGKDDFTLVMRKYDELMVVGVNGREPPEATSTQKHAQEQKAMEAKREGIATSKYEMKDYEVAQLACDRLLQGSEGEE